MYNLTIGLVHCWGFLINVLLIKALSAEILSDYLIPILFIYIFSCGYGVYLFSTSKSTFMRFTGYNFVFVPFGFIVNLIVHTINPNIVLNTFRITGLVTFFMMMIGSIFPNFFKRILGSLIVLVLAIMVVEYIELNVLGRNQVALIWIVTITFCGYLSYKWTKSNTQSKTIGNAVDGAVSVYMDILGIFGRLISSFGHRR